MNHTRHDDSDESSLSPDDNLRLWVATIRYKWRFGLIAPQLSRRGLLSGLARVLACLLGSGRKAGGR